MEKVKKNRLIRIANYTLSQKITATVATQGNHVKLNKEIQLAIDSVCNENQITEAELDEKILNLLKINFQLVPMRRGRVMIKVPEKISSEKSSKNAYKLVAKVIKFKVNPITNKFVSTKKQNISLFEKTRRELQDIFNGSGKALERLSDIKAVAQSNMAFVKRV